MQPCQAFGLLALCQLLTTAHGQRTTEMMAFHRIPGDDLLSVSPPETRQVAEICQILNTAVTVVHAVPDKWKAEVVGVGGASLSVGFSTWATCKAWTNGQNCEAKGAAIGSYVGIALSGVVIYNNMPTQGAEAETKRHDALQERYSDYLLSRGIDFEAVDVVPSITSRSDYQHEDDTIHIKIIGLRDADGLVSDHEMTLGSRTAVSRTSIPSHSDGLVQRASGTGFKINYDFTHLETGTFVEENDIDALCYNVGADWGNRADESHNIGSYKATLHLGDAYTVDLVITPETGSNWSEDWETLKC